MKLLLLVQSEADVAHLDACAQAILNSAFTGVWVVFSPAITVNASEAASKLDAEIDTLRAAERQAAERSDYTAAAGYKVQREEKELDRQKALRNAWKTASAEDRQTRTKDIFAPFIAHLKPNGLNVRITGHSEHHDRDQWVAMLNSLSGVWFKEYQPGSFVVAWPEAVELAIKKGTTERWAEIVKAGEQPAPHPRTVAKTAGEVVGMSRREELEATHHMTLRPIAKSLGIDPAGKTTGEIIDAIIAAEKPVLAEY